MKSYLEHSKVRLTLKSPVYIGSGIKLSKKQYVLDRKMIYIIDTDKLMNIIIKKNLINDYYRFINSKNTLKMWLDSNNLKDYKALSSYVLNGTENINDTRSLKDIDTCIKDAYERPYIPGSSLKGAIRNIILWNRVYDAYHDSDAKTMRENLLYEVHNNVGRKINGKLKPYSTKLEKKFFNKKIGDVDVSIMRGLVIGDSKPLSLDDISICTKIDVDMDGNENTINIFRECIKPGTVVEFDLTIDKEILGLDTDDIKQMISDYSEDYFKVVTNYFQDDGNIKDSIYIGGGAGYFSKTVTYSFFEREDAVDFIKTYLTNTYLTNTTDKRHKHFKDKEISPHMQKCTEHNNKLYEMGKCVIEILKE